MKYITLLLIALTYGHVSAIGKSENKTFVATKEWQQIAEGQAIPAGLHVRINLETGKKEAKLMDESEQDAESAAGGKAALATVPENASEAPPKGTASHKLKISKTLSDALKSLPKDGLALEYSPEKLEKIKHEYKSYKELKESYDDMRKNFKTDAELITQFVAEYHNATKSELERTSTKATQNRIATQLRVLDNLNYLVHQIDNALWFIDLGGLDQLLLPLVVNQTHVGLRVQAMRVLGAVTQNNPNAQIKVFERNFGSHLSQILISSTNTEELSTALYAFGSLLRKFPHAQERILSTSGTQALVTLLAKETELKVKAKAVTLISDLILERGLAVESAKQEDHKVAAAQYADFDFPHWLQVASYCETLDTLISGQLYALLEQPDLMEYFAQALDSTQHFCRPRWSQNPQLRHTLLTLKNRYTQSQEEYRLEVAQQIDKLVVTFYNQDLSHDEL